MNSSPSWDESWNSRFSSGLMSTMKGSMWRPAFCFASGWYSMCLRASVAPLEKLMLLSCSRSDARHTTGPSASLSSMNVPSRTPSARAILMSGPNEGRFWSVSMEIICASERPLRSAISATERFLDSLIPLIFNPTIGIERLIVYLCLMNLGTKLQRKSEILPI